MKKNTLFFLILFAHLTIFAQQEPLWKRINDNNRTILAKNNKNSDINNQQLYELDGLALKKTLNTITDKKSVKDGVEITIPNTKGDLERFLVWESSNFESDLQAKFPDIRAYAGIGITDPKATLNFSLSPSGIQSMVLRAGSSSEFIESYSKQLAVCPF